MLYSDTYGVRSQCTGFRAAYRRLYTPCSAMLLVMQGQLMS